MKICILKNPLLPLHYQVQQRICINITKMKNQDIINAAKEPANLAKIAKATGKFTRVFVFFNFGGGLSVKSQPACYKEAIDCPEINKYNVQFIVFDTDKKISEKQVLNILQ